MHIRFPYNALKDELKRSLYPDCRWHPDTKSWSFRDTKENRGRAFIVLEKYNHDAEHLLDENLGESKRTPRLIQRMIIRIGLEMFLQLLKDIVSEIYAYWIPVSGESATKYKESYAFCQKIRSQVQMA